MADLHSEEPTGLQVDRSQQQDSMPEASTAASEATSSTQAQPAQTGDPAASDQPLQPPQPSKRSKPWPAYFFPALAAQRTSFCLDILKREDIKSVRAFSFSYIEFIVARSFQADLMRVSDITGVWANFHFNTSEPTHQVCEFGCGQGAVLKPMTNGATHIDSFPEAIFDEGALMAEEADEVEETESQVEQQETIQSATREDTEREDKTTEDDEESLAPSQSASRRHSLDEEIQVAEEEISATTSDSHSRRGRSPPRGRQGSSTFNHPAPSTSKVSLNTEILEKYKALPGPRVQDKELHLRRIAGLDISQDSLLEAIEVTAPPPEEPSPFFTYFSYSNRDRWEDLRVELWQGSLDVYNDTLDNFEAFIMTEVIEHLYEKQLSKFPDLLFGSYRPRIIVITTPNYDFNKFFNKAKQASADEVSREMGEKLEDETKSSYKDPTGRTDRYFRDDDHKFEWTEEEFKNWCEGITSKFDYTVEYSGVGSLRNYFGKNGMHSLSEPTTDSSSSSKTPPPHIQEILDSVPDPSKMYATQTAVFRRKFAYESERSPRSPIQMPLAFYGVKPRPISRSNLSQSPSSTISSLLSSTTTRKSAKQRSNDADPESGSSASRSPDQRHKLLKAHYFKAHPQAGNAKSSKTIRHLLDDLMRDRMRARSVSLRELWGRNEVAQACGGYINKLITALARDPECEWDIEFDPAALEKRGEVEDAVRVVLKDFIEPEVPSYQALEEGAEEEDEKEDFMKNRDSDNDDSDNENENENGHASTKDDDKDEQEGHVFQLPPQLSKKQKKLKRMQEAPFLVPIFPIENMDEKVWMPEKGSEDAKVWEEWAEPARSSTMITEQEWAKESDKKTASGWD